MSASSPAAPAPPRYPQQGFYETTKVKMRGPNGRWQTYSHEQYEAQREMDFGNITRLRDQATERMLDEGWTPTVLGVLVAPGEPRPPMDQHAIDQMLDQIVDNVVSINREEPTDGGD